MDIKRKSPTLTEIDGRIRVESGPVRRTAEATEEVLATLPDHYAVGKPDALGKTIALGEPMDFIDWLAPERAFYVYELVDGRWQPRGAYATEDAALSAAATLATTPSTGD